MAHVSDVQITGSSLVTRFADLRAQLATRFAQYRTYRNTLAELQSLSKRELNDLGLNRHALHTIAHEAAYGAK